MLRNDHVHQTFIIFAKFSSLLLLNTQGNNAHLSKYPTQLNLGNTVSFKSLNIIDNNNNVLINVG